MKTAALKIKNYSQSVSIVDSGDLSARLLHILITLVLALSITYIFILSGTVYNIIVRKALETEARALSTEVRELELEYLAASGRINLAKGEELGFTEAKAVYAVRKALGRKELSQNEI